MEYASVRLETIGVIRSPHVDPAGMPIQPSAAVGVQGRIELDPRFEAGLRDIDGFSHLWLLYWLHQVKSSQLTVVPFLDRQEHGIFATRAPPRPNPIGLSLVRLIRRRGSSLLVENLDVLDGTPLLDIKPYVPAFDSTSDARIGWFAGKLEDLGQARADARFAR